MESILCKIIGKYSANWVFCFFNGYVNVEMD